MWGWDCFLWGRKMWVGDDIEVFHFHKIFGLFFVLCLVLAKCGWLNIMLSLFVLSSQKPSWFCIGYLVVPAI